MIAQSFKHFFLPLSPSKKSIKLFLNYLLIIMGVIFFAYFMVQANAILRSSHATVSVGFIFIPLVATLKAYKAWIFAIALAYLFTSIAVRSPKFNLFVLIFLMIVIRCVWVFSVQAIEVINTKSAIYEINLLHNATDLDEKFNAYQTHPKESQRFILEAIALNPFTAHGTLMKMAKINESFVNEPIVSLFYYQPTNDQGMSVKILLAKHPNAPKDLLKTLSLDADPKVRETAKESIIKLNTKH